MRYLLCAFSPGNFLIELLPGLFKLIIAQADLLLKMFKSFQRDPPLVLVWSISACFRAAGAKKVLSIVSILICIAVCKSDAPSLKVIKPSSESMIRR
jgi:hypothetical protein